MDIETNKKIASLLFPQITKTVDDLEQLYKNREVPQGAYVTRFAPSPTGFLHIGGVFTALIEERLAHQSGGIFILRIEDTDKKREVEGGIDEIANGLRGFDIIIDEGMWTSKEQLGAYGPYLQSERKEMYGICAKHLIEQGLAYPCFCTPEELEASRQEQANEKVKSGYYGKWATHRNISLSEVEENLKIGKPFAIRIKSEGDGHDRVTFKDEIKGSITMPVNDQDYVMLKSDGYATYHFAHPIDDHFMHITLILRGDEWLPSTPLHLQVFKYFGWTVPPIAHDAPIMKTDGISRRKLSKRKDPEADVKYYITEGYTADSVKEYLLNIINSNFEDWRKQNPTKSSAEFPLSLAKMSKSGALFDMVKLEDISKQVIGRMSPEAMYDSCLGWATLFDAELAKEMGDNKEYMIKIFSIEKDQQGKRKDIAKWSQIRDNFGFFFDTEFDLLTKDSYVIPAELHKEDMIKVMQAYIPMVSHINMDKNEWFSEIKKIAESMSYTTDTKAYRQNPEAFRGYVGDLATFLRIALCNKVNTPDLQEIMKVMGEERVKARLEKFSSYIMIK